MLNTEMSSKVFGGSVLFLFFFVLIGPMIVNGFPLLYYDSATYLSPGHFYQFRNMGYGFFLDGIYFLGLRAWCAIAVQAILVILVLNSFSSFQRIEWKRFFLISSPIFAFSPLPRMVSFLMPDIFTGLTVILVFLLLERRSNFSLMSWKGMGLLILFIFSFVTHITHALLFLIWIPAWLLIVNIRHGSHRIAWRRLGVAFVLAGLVFASEQWIKSRLNHVTYPTQLSLLGRLADEDLLKKHIVSICDRHPEFRLCVFKTEILSLPIHRQGYWFWRTDYPIYRAYNDGIPGHYPIQIARPDEVEAIVHDILWRENIALIPVLLRRTVYLAVMAPMNPGLPSMTGELASVLGAFSNHTHEDQLAAQAARQQQDDCSWIAAYQKLMMGSVLVFSFLHLGFVACGRRLGRRFYDFALFSGGAILCNHAICANLSDFDMDRMNFRVSWLSALVVIVGVMMWFQRRRRLKE